MSVNLSELSALPIATKQSIASMLLDELMIDADVPFKLKTETGPLYVYRSQLNTYEQSRARSMQYTDAEIEILRKRAEDDDDGVTLEELMAEFPLESGNRHSHQ